MKMRYNCLITCLSQWLSPDVEDREDVLLTYLKTVGSQLLEVAGLKNKVLFFPVLADFKHLIDKTVQAWYCSVS